MAKHTFTFHVHEPRPPRTQVVEGTVIKIGSSESADVRIADPAAAPLHATIEALSAHDIKLVDLGSEHGTHVDGSRVEHCQLTPGSRIVIGATTIDLISSEAPLAEVQSYRASPLAESEPAEPIAEPVIDPDLVQLTSPKEAMIEVAVRWWPVPLSVALGAWYFIAYGLALPKLTIDGLAVEWPVPPLPLVTTFVGSLFALGDAVFRRPNGDRTPLGRLLLVLGGLVTFPVALQVGIGLISIGGAIAGVVVAIVAVIMGAIAVGKWILRGAKGSE